MAKTTVATPATNTFTEQVAISARKALLEDNGFIRGWQAFDDPDVKAAIEERNARESARCKAALLASLRA